MDTRRELGLINKQVRSRNRQAGEYIIWYQFADLGTGESVYDDVYDEGAPGVGGKVYFRGIHIPTIFVEEVEDEFRAIDTGRQPTQNLQAKMLFKDVEAAGILNPREYQTHLNDMFEYDSRFYRVRAYQVRGRMNKEHPNGEALVLVRGVEVFPDQEMPYSFAPTNPQVHDLPWPTSFPS